MQWGYGATSSTHSNQEANDRMGKIEHDLDMEKHKRKVKMDRVLTEKRRDSSNVAPVVSSSRMTPEVSSSLVASEVSSSTVKPDVKVNINLIVSMFCI